MFERLSEYWEAYGFEILFFLSVFFLLVMFLLRKGKKGSYNKIPFFSYFQTQPAQPEIIQSVKNHPPRESKGEIECRRVLENIYGKPFPKQRPDFLRNPVTSDFSDYNLELDMYNSELKIAVEYHGIQHYKFVPFFHKTKETFMNQKYRDHIKREICEKNGILLIEVPYTVKIPDIYQYISDRLPNQR